MSSNPEISSTLAFRQGIDLRRLPGTRKLIADYSFDFDKLATFFAGDPSRPDAWRSAIGRAQRQVRPRGEIADAIKAQLARRGAAPAAIEAADRLRNPQTVAIVTGQQAGLFGGPLFTLYKALTAIRLAERVTREHQTPAVAIFWVDAEDHDWEEVRHLRILDDAQDIRRVSLGRPEGAGESPVASIRLDRSVETALEQLGHALPRTEFTDTLLARLSAAYQVGTGMAEAFATWLDSELGPRGVVVFESADPALKTFAAPVFVEELERPGHTSELAARAGAALAERGYHAQVVSQPDSLALFHLDGARQPLRKRDRGVAVGDDVRTLASLVNEAQTTPNHFSPNVLLRPVVQDTLFPTVAYVAGPNELAYLGQLKVVYEHFAVPMPLMYPRASLTVLDSGAVRFLSRYDIPIQDLQPQDDAALNRLLEAQLPQDVEQAFAVTQTTMREHLERLASAVQVVDPTLEGAARSTVGRMEHDLSTFHGKVIQAAKRKDETLRRQFLRTRSQVFPDGEPQERVLGFIHFLNRYGSAFTERIGADLPLDLGQHWLLSI